MAEMLENIEYLASEIGPRPAATEEEQQAALYIEDRFKEMGLPAEVEEFQSAVSDKKTRLVCSALMLIGVVGALALSMLALPGLLLTIVGAGLLIAEERGIPVLSGIIDKGISQNVVARFEPTLTSQQQSSRRRKVILVAHYDSGYVRPEAKAPLLGIVPVLATASRACLIVLPVLMLFKSIFMLHASGVPVIVLNVLIVIALICALLPVISILLQKTSGYNEAANCNAAGVAVMLEVAKRVNSGVADDDMAEEPVMHGAEEAYAQNVVPQGAELVYDAPVASTVRQDISFAAAPAAVPAPQTAQSLMDAKAAIAALTGRPVSNTVSIDLPEDTAAPEFPDIPDNDPVAEQFPAPDMPAFEANAPAAVAAGVPAAVAVGAAGFGVVGETAAAAVAAQAAAASANVPDVNVAAAVATPAADTLVMQQPSVANIAISAEPEPVQQSSVPSWFAAGRAAARKTGLVEQPANVKRSQFASALNAAENRIANNYAPVVAAEPAAQPVQPTVSEYAPVAQAPAAQSEPLIPPANFAASPLAAVAETAPTTAPATRETPLPPLESGMIPRVIEPAASPAPVAQVEAAPVFAAPVAAAVPEISVQPEPAPLPANDYFTQAAQAANEQSAADAGKTVAMPAAFNVALPEMTSNLSSVEAGKQRAPLAQAASEGQGSAAKSLLTMLPSIDTERPDSNSLRSLIPSLSGSMNPVESAPAPSLSGSFAPVAGATAAFAPVTEALVAEAIDQQIQSEDDLFVDDADDSSFDQGYTETGAYAGPGYVEMPKKRFGLFGRLFGREDREEEVSTNEWLDVDDDFEARSVGAARGSWESFNEDSDNSFTFDDEDQYDDAYDPDEDDAWQGGAFSRLRDAAVAGADGLKAGAGSLKDKVGAARGGAAMEDVPEEGEGRRHRSRRAEEGQDAPEPQESGRRRRSLMGDDEQIAAMEQQSIFDFRASAISTEVWFVALGAEVDNHAGIKAFIADHAQDLRGAMIVELDGLGAGELCRIEKEGAGRAVTYPSRMRRFINKASVTSGIKAGTASIQWNESSASVAAKLGQQAMHLAGMDGIKPMYFAEADDVADNIDPQILDDNAKFVVEMLKNI